MLFRRLPFAALLLAAMPLPFLRADEEKKAPTIVLRIQAIEDLMANVRYLADQNQQGDQVQQLEGMLQAFGGAKGLGGIDTKRPLGLYGSITPDMISSAAVILLPVADEKAVLGLLTTFNVQADKGKDGVYTVIHQALPIPIYFRFAKQYAFVTARDKKALDADKLLDPTTLLKGEANDLLSAVVRIDQIPDALKQIFLNQLEVKMADEQDKRGDDETDAQHAFKVAMLKKVSQLITDAVNEGDRLSLRYGVDRPTHLVSMELSLSAKPDSPLAETLADLGKSQSLFGGSRGGDSAMTILFHGLVPKEVNKALVPVFEEGFRKSIKAEKDEKKRAQAANFLKVLLPTLQAGELDLGVRFRGPKDGKYTVIGGLKLTDGAGFEQAIRKLLDEAPEEERKKVALDVEKVGSVSVHRLEAQKDFDEKSRKAFGNHPVYLAFRPDAMLVTMGPEGLPAMKDAIVAKPQSARFLDGAISLNRFAPFLANENKQALSAARKAFGKAKDRDQIHFSVEGGKTLTARFSMHAPVMQFFTLMGESGAKAEGPARPKVRVKVKTADE